MKRLIIMLFMIAIGIITIGTASYGEEQWINLFNGSDLSNWTVGGAAWTVENGILKNTRGYETDWIQCNSSLPSDNFIFDMRVRMVSGMRLRTHMCFNSIYIGNEGSIKQFEVYGKDITQVSQVGEDSYVNGQWYDLKLVVKFNNRIELYKDNVLTHTALRTQQFPSQIVIVPGDHWSEGRVEISSIRYAIVPEPSSILTLLYGIVGLGGIVARRKSK